MTPEQYRALKNSMSLSNGQLARLLGYKNRSSISYIESGRSVDERGHLPKRIELAITALKERHDRNKRQ